MKKVWFLMIAMLLGITMLSGCVSLTGRTAGEIIDDSSITTAINAEIVKDPELRYLKINVDSTRGNVVLSGFVPNKRAEKRLIELSKGIRGVRSVKSNLKVEEKK